MKKLVLITLITCLAGCSFTPTYERPAMPVPKKYKEDRHWRPAKPDLAAMPRGDWWKLYHDMTLDALEAKVTCANQNVQLAVARFEESRTILAEQRAALFPSIMGVFNVDRVGISSNIANPPTTTVYNDKLLSANVSYELDVWGRVRNTIANARSLAAASAADLAAVDLSMHAALANDYFALRGDDASQRVLDKAVEVYGKQLYLIRKRYQGGAVSAYDFQQAIAQLDTAKTLAADMRLRRAQLEHAIAVLIGEPPATFSLAVAQPHAKTVTIAPHLPSTLLERRPDIAEAELRVQAANYNIGVARAAFFPAVNLSAGIGFESTLFGNLMSHPSLTWALGPSAVSTVNSSNNPLATQTIYDGGRLIALSQQAWAQYHQTVASYRQTVLNAFQEVEDGLVALRRLDQENQTQTAATTAANRAVAQAMYRYQGGLTTYLDVVTIQNTALQAQLSMVDIRTRRQLASVKLIQALGGGYSDKAAVEG